MASPCAVRSRAAMERLEERRLLSAVVTGTFLPHEKSGIQPNTVNDVLLNRLPVDTNYVETYEGGPIGNLTDGKTAENPSNLDEPSQLPDFGNSVFDLGHGVWYATYHLDSQSHPGGYDLTEIDSITGHQDTRTDQTIDIQVQYVGDSGFYSLSAGKNFSYRPGQGDGAAKLALTDTSGVLARGVSAVKFVAADENAVFRELVVTGTPSRIATAPPAAPTGLTAQTGDGQTITLSFVSGSSNASEFLLDRMPPPQYPNQSFVPVAVFGPATAGQTITFTDTAVPMGGPVVYRVRALNNFGGGSASAPQTVQSIAGWLIQGRVNLTTWVPDGTSPIVTNGGIGGALAWIDLNNNGKVDPGEPTATTDWSTQFTIAGHGAAQFTVRHLPGNDVYGNPYEYMSPITGALQVSVTDGQASVAWFTDTEKGEEPPGVHVMPAPSGPVTGQPAPSPPGGTGGGSTSSGQGTTAPSPLSVTIRRSVILQMRQTGGVGAARFSVVDPATSRVNQTVGITVYAAPVGSASGQIAVGSATRRLRLRPGRSVPMSLRLRVPAGLSPGQYGLIVVIRPAGGDTSTAMATQAVGHLTVNPAAADLAVSFADPTAPVLAQGRPASQLLRIANVGTLPTRGDLMLTFVASNDTTVDASDVLLESESVRVSLAPGRSRRIRAHFVTPAALAPGSYYLIASIAGQTEPADSNPQNDTAASPPGTVFR